MGGDNVYEFLNLSTSARITGLGGNLITVKDDDIALAYANPSVLNPRMHNALSFNYNFHVAGIGNGYAGYARHIKKWDATVHGGIQYINYGTFDATDNIGNVQGTFGAAEYALTVGVGKQVHEKYSIGANVKLISSQFESYHSLGVAADVGAYYSDTTGRFGATLLFKNIGTQITTYENKNFEPLPFEIQFGVSRRLKHLPFRFSIIAHNLQRWNITYDDPANVESTFILGAGDQPGESDFNVFIDNFFQAFYF